MSHEFEIVSVESFGHGGEGVLVTLETSVNLYRIWSHIRGSSSIPVVIRKCSSVWMITPPLDGLDSAKKTAEEDVDWRVDSGYVCAVPWSGGYVLGWCGPRSVPA